jgi:hypothetical protein
LVSLIASSCAALALTGCGGGAPEDYTAHANNTQTSPGTELRASSKSPDTFGNFNPAIWNEHDWYECNCGRNPETTQPVTTPWMTES